MNKELIGLMTEMFEYLQCYDTLVVDKDIVVPFQAWVEEVNNHDFDYVYSLIVDELSTGKYRLELWRNEIGEED